jgi:hypothetical protein
MPARAVAVAAKQQQHDQNDDEEGQRVHGDASMFPGAVSLIAAT